jgi:CO dehydrogenase maturation factor
VAAQRLAVVGKGGAGKSVIAGTLARLLARDGRRVLALDSDMLPGLTLSLGAEAPRLPPLIDAAERDETGRWRLKRGIGPVRAVARYSTSAPDGIRLLQAGKVGPEGLPAIMPALQAYYKVVHRLPRAATFADWTILGDLPAGPRQAAFGWAPYADTFVLVVEPTSQSLLAARRIARVVAQREPARIVTVANKVRVPADVERIESFLATKVAAAVPVDEAVRAAERSGAALVDSAPASAAVAAVAALAAHLEGGTIRP